MRMANYTFDLKDRTLLVCTSNTLSVLGLLDHHWLIKNDVNFITPTRRSLFFTTVIFIVFSACNKLCQMLLKASLHGLAFFLLKK